MKLLQLSTLSMALVSQIAVGGESHPVDRTRFESNTPGQVAALQAATIARANTGGRVLDVRPLQNEATAAYRVRLLIDPGRVRTVIVDADSGLVR